MKYRLYAVVTALAFWKLKAKVLKLKAAGEWKEVQLTRRLPPRSIAEPSASLVAMTGGEGIAN